MVCKKALLVAALFITVLVTSGCWDRKEIENRGFVLGAAIDRASPEAKGRYDIERSFQQAGTRKFRLSYELQKPKPGGGEKKSGGEDEKSIVYSAEGESIFAATRAINSQTKLTMFLEDLQVILISEEVAREGIREVFSLFVRDPEMRRRAKVYIAKGKAEDFFKGKPKTGEVSSLILVKLESNAEKSPTFGGKSELGYISEALHGKKGFSVPMLYFENDQIKAAGTALFNRKGRMAGIGDEYETIGAKIWRKILKQGLVVVPNPDDPETILVFELYESKIVLKPVFQGNTVHFILEADFTGNLGESIPMLEKPFSKECLKKTEQAVAAEYTNHAYAALEKLQTVRADTLELGGLIHHKNPQYWDKIKDRWEDEIFPSVEADVKIKVTIRGTGITR